MSSRLFQRIRESSAWLTQSTRFSPFTKMQNARRLWERLRKQPERRCAINDELDMAPAQGLSEVDLAAGKSQLKGQINCRSRVRVHGCIELPESSFTGAVSHSG